MMKTLIITLLLCCCIADATAQTITKISQLPAGATPGAADLFPSVQSGTTVTVNGSQIKSYVVGGLTITSTTGTLSIAAGKTLTLNNTLTLTGTDGSTLNFGGGGTLGTAAYTAASSYLPATTGSSLLAGNGSGGTANVTAGSGITFASNTLSVSSAPTAVSFTGSLAGDVTGTQGATTVGKINGASLGGLATGLLKNTTSTGVPTIAIAGTDYLPATSGSSILSGNGSGGTSNVTVGSGLTFTGGTLTATGSGSGTVTTLSTGNLSPLFTTSVATATTTPAVTFALSSAAQNSVLAGPASGGPGAPSYQALPVISGANLTALPTNTSLYPALAGDVTGGLGATTVGKINGTALGGLSTGLLKNTTSTGVPTIAVANTDYLPATTGSTLVAGSGSGGLTNVTVGTGLSFSGGTLSSTSGSSAYSGYKNVIIGGDFGTNPWQRGTTFTGISTNTSVTYTADRWGVYAGATGASITVSKGTASPRQGSSAYFQMGRPSGNTSTASINAAQVIETQNVIPLQGQSVVLSFFPQAGANYSGGSNFTVKVISGTGNDEGSSALISGWTGASTLLSGTPAAGAAWISRVNYAFTVPASATELAVIISYFPSGTAGAADFLNVAQVQLEANSSVTNFELRPIGLERILCQRYYAYGANLIDVGNAISGNIRFSGLWPTVMRVTPTLVQGSGNNTAPGGFDNTSWTVVMPNGSLCFYIAASAEL